MIKNLIFDFGGVLYEINLNLTLSAFKNLAENQNLFQKAINKKNYIKIITDYEKGNIDTNKFRKYIKKEFNLSCSNQEFDKAWNSLLIKQFDFSIPLIKKLKQNFNLYLLSNTNMLHYNHFLPQCRELFSLFKKCYFSFKIGSVKPEVEIFEFLIKQAKIYSDESLFIDDSKDNIQTATEIGFQTFLVDNHNTEMILDILNN